MDKYISLEEAKKFFNQNFGSVSHAVIASRLLDEIPAADVSPVRHGRWESVKNPQWPAYSHDKCSLCGWWNTKNALCYDGRKKPGHALNYCPNCGAKMDKEDKL